MTEWSGDDSAAALREGWDIFQTDGFDHAPFELERLDDPVSDPEFGLAEPVFRGDAGAWKHVFFGSLAGNELHLRAIAFLQEQSPSEYKHITRWLGREYNVKGAVQLMLDDANSKTVLAEFTVDEHDEDDFTKAHPSGFGPACIDWEGRGVYFAYDPGRVVDAGDGLDDDEFETFIDAMIAWWNCTIIPLSEDLERETMLLTFEKEHAQHWATMQRVAGGNNLELFLFGTDSK